ncbi:MAG: N-acetyltransferase [Candidatus Hydrogenedentes bacterium]|nr:N-acetyltransferase [Candidatus Hydrogenedentota bacterium]
MPKCILRAATPADAEAILSIYAPYVRDTAVSFDTEVPDQAAYARHIEEHLHRYPWLVAEQEREVIGYSYASLHRTRAAYRWSVESSIYIAAKARRSGVGRALYTALFDLLRRQGFVRCYAGITLPNPASLGFHEAFGFEPVGVYHAAGFKQGRWYDVGWWEYAIVPLPGVPQEPMPFSVLELEGELMDGMDKMD